MMTLEGVRKFISLNDADKHLFDISIIPLGEALLNPEIFDIIEALHDAGYTLNYIATNLAVDLLTETQINTLCLFNMIGVNYATRNIDPSLVKKTYNNVLALQKALGDRAPDSLKIVKVMHPEETFTMPEEFTGTLVSQPMVMYSESFYNNVTQGSSQPYSEYLQRLNLDPTSYNIDSDREIAYLPASMAASTSDECGFALNVRPNGTLSTCAVSTADEAFKIGDAYSQSIRDLVASPTFVSVTESQRLKKFSLCTDCMTCSINTLEGIQKAFE